MNRAILLAVFWSLTTALVVAQEPLAPAVATPATNAPAAKPAIVLIIDPNARQSEVVKQVVEALEKAGIATADSPDKVTPSTSAIHVTLSMRADESYEKIKHLVEALQAAGVEQLSFQAGGVQEAGKEAQNNIRIIAQPNSTAEELHRIEQAIINSAKQSGLMFVVSTQIPGQNSAPAFDPSDLLQKELAKFVGKWQEATRKTFILEFKLQGDQLHYIEYDEGRYQTGTIRLDLDPTPHRIELNQRGNSTMPLLGLYAWDGLNAASERPTRMRLALDAGKYPMSLEDKLASPMVFERMLVDNQATTNQVKVFTLKYAQATDVAEVLKNLYDKGPAKIAADARTNSVVVTGPVAQLEEIEALLQKLDEGGPANPNARKVPVDPAQSEAAKLVVQLEDELAQLQQSVGANHPKVKELQARIAAARQNVQPDAASRLPGTPVTNVNPLGEIEQLDAEGEGLRQRLSAEKANFERIQALMKKGVISAQNAQEAEASVRVSEALLAAHEAQRSAVLQKFKAQLLKALDDSLENIQSSGQIEKAELQDAEKQIEAIITQVDNSPQQALAAADHLISQLDSVLVKRLEKAIETTRTDDSRIGTWQTALRQAQRRARTRKLLPGSLPATETLSGQYDRAFQAQTEAGSRLPAVSLGNGDGTGSTSGEVQQQIAQLRKEYEAADSEARQLARQLQTTPDGAQKKEAQKADLRRAVQRAFTARQSLLRAELLEMHDKLLKTQRSIDLRERISDQIIQRRVEDLLNPQLEWEGKTPAGPPLSKAVDARPSDTRRVLVALNDIRPGERLVEGKNVAFKEFPQSALVTYNGDLVQSADEFSIRVAVKIPYEAGDLIRKTRLTEMGQIGTGASAQIPKGMRVFTFQADATHIHSGLLRPGDKVDVMVTFVDRKGNMVTKVLLECIEVFATEINAVYSDEDQNKQRPRGVSLLVTPEQDGFVKIAQSKGQLALSLRNPDDEEVSNPNGINAAIMEELVLGAAGPHPEELAAGQKAQWKSGSVLIAYLKPSLGLDDSLDSLNRGVVVTTEGLTIAHLPRCDLEKPIHATFDDGTRVEMQLVEKSPYDIFALRPKSAVQAPFSFPLSSQPVAPDDVVLVSADGSFDISPAKLLLIDRQLATGLGPVWQLDDAHAVKSTEAVINASGELLAMAFKLRGADAVLAVPVEKLREILPESVGKLSILPTKQTSAPEPAREAPTDPQAALLAKLQGVWDVEVQSSDLPKEKLPFKINAEIHDNVMTWSFDPPQPDNDNPPVFQIKLGELGTPQSVDLVSGPNDGEDQRAVLPGIMEVGQDLVRICVNVNSHGTRPEMLVAGKNVDIYTLRRLSKQSRTPQPAAKPEPDSSQAAMLAKLQGRWHLTIQPTSVLGMGLFLKDSEEAEAVIEGQVMKVFYTKALVPDLLEDSRDPFLAYAVKITFGETGSPQPVDLLFGPNEEPVNRRLALGIAEFSDDVIRLCFDRATESESIRPEVLAVGAKGEIWELRREPPASSRGYVLDRLQGVWQGTWKPDFTLPAGADVPTIDGIVHIQGSRMAVSWQPDEEIEVRLGATGPAPNPAQNIDLLFKDRKTKATNELLGVVAVSGEEIILRLGDCNEEDRPKSIVGAKDEATFTLKLSKLPPGAFPDLGAQCELAGPLPQGAGQGKFRGGLRIAKVFAGTPAAEGGFASGDILVGFHVWQMTRLEDLQYALAQKLKGEVSFHVIRSGVVRKGYVLLDGSRRPDTDTELSPDQLTSIPVEYDCGIAIPVAQLQKVIPNAQEHQQEKPGDSKPPTVEADPRDNAGSQDSRLSPFQGRWKVDFFGSPNRSEQWERVEIKGNTLTCFGAIDEKSSFARDYRLTLGSPDDPRAVDLRETEGNQTWPGLIEKTRDGLALCLGLDGQRPAEFGEGDQRTCLRLIPQPAEPEPPPAPADSKASNSDSEKPSRSQQ